MDKLLALLADGPDPHIPNQFVKVRILAQRAFRQHRITQACREKINLFVTFAQQKLKPTDAKMARMFELLENELKLPTVTSDTTVAFQDTHQFPPINVHGAAAAAAAAAAAGAAGAAGAAAAAAAAAAADDDNAAAVGIPPLSLPPAAPAAEVAPAAAGEPMTALVMMQWPPEQRWYMDKSGTMFFGHVPSNVVREGIILNGMLVGC